MSKMFQLLAELLPFCKLMLRTFNYRLGLIPPFWLTGTKRTITQFSSHLSSSFLSSLILPFPISAVSPLVLFSSGYLSFHSILFVYLSQECQYSSITPIGRTLKKFRKHFRTYLLTWFSQPPILGFRNQHI